MVAVVAAIMALLAALLLGQPAGQAVAEALIVGAGTFVAIFAWHSVRAPSERRAEQARRLTEWRARYEPDYEARGESVILRLTAVAENDFDGVTCLVRTPDQDEASSDRPTAFYAVAGIVNTPAADWHYPAWFGVRMLPDGPYVAIWGVRGHPEPIGEVHFERRRGQFA